MGSFAFESQARQTTSSNANASVIARLDEVKSWQSISLLWIATILLAQNLAMTNGLWIATLAKAILAMTA